MRKFLLFILTVGMLVGLGLILANHAFKKEPPVVLACIGDSITEGSGLDNPAADSYPSQLQRMLGDRYDVKNFGLSGRTALNKGENPYMMEDTYLQALESLPDIVTIKLGTNDSKPQCWVYKDEFESDLGQMVDSFKYLPSDPDIFLCLPVPAFSDGWGIDSLIIANEIIPAIRKVAREKGVAVIDLNTPMRAYPEDFPDGIHPSPSGARKIAEIIANAITPV